MTFTDRESRTRPLPVLGVVALAGPAVLAFFAGGYFDGPRVWAGLVTWALVVVAMFSSSHPLPARLGGRLALIGLGLLALWTLLSFTWAPIAGNAYHAGQRVILYAGALLAAAALLRLPIIQRAVEPVLALGALVVIGYGLSERMLPGLLQFSRSVSAQGRLEQPLTYWNAMGEVAALGLVLAVRVAGDARDERAMRTAAACACAPLGMGLYLSFSRGALFACLAGVVTLIVAAPQRAQLKAMIVCSRPPSWQRSRRAVRGRHDLSGSLSTRERQGAIVFVALAAIVAVTGRRPMAPGRARPDRRRRAAAGGAVDRAGADLRRPRGGDRRGRPREGRPDPRRRRRAAGDAAEQSLRVLARRRQSVSCTADPRGRRGRLVGLLAAIPPV